MEKLFIHLYLVILSAMNYIQSQQPSGYIGCYDQNTFGKINTKMRTRFNNGTYCIKSCTTNGYRYAGTQIQTCKCGNELLVVSQQSTCNCKCSGQRRELCGGENSMSVYDSSLIPDTHDSTASMPIMVVSTTSAQTISVQTISVSTTSVPTSLMSTTSVPTTAEPTTSVLTTAEPTTSVPTNSLPTALKPTTQFYQQTGEITDDLSVYVSVPIVVVVVVAIVLVVMFFLKRKRRRNGEQCTCLRRKKVENYRFQATTNKTYNINSLNDDDSCFRYSPENVQNSSANIYAEIKFGSTQSIETSENAKTGQSTFSFGVPKGRDEAGASDNIGIYDTLQTCAKANTIKISDCSQSVYDHVIVGHHNNQITGINEYSHIGAVQINNVQQTHYRIKDNQNQRDNRSDRSSADCGDPDDMSDKNSADCVDQDNQSFHDYVILEPEGHFIVK